jgi:hypothetical protein
MSLEPKKLGLNGIEGEAGVPTPKTIHQLVISLTAKANLYPLTRLNLRASGKVFLMGTNTQ